MFAAPLFALSLLTSVHSINVSISKDPNCRGGIHSIRSFQAIPDDGCFIRGDYENLMELDMNGGIVEMAVAASIDDEASQSEYIAFFTSTDCNPDSLIEDTFLELGCRDDKAKDYKSWAVWDTCEEAECSLGM
jgi:hypothetical protein